MIVLYHHLKYYRKQYVPDIHGLIFPNNSYFNSVGVRIYKATTIWLLSYPSMRNLLSTSHLLQPFDKRLPGKKGHVFLLIENEKRDFIF